ncbi:MAG: hypothetical protein QM736_29815 [Vicinamibacterales bacterium]
MTLLLVAPTFRNMTVTLELNPDVEAGLLAQAEARGLTLEEYVQQVLRERSGASLVRAAVGSAAKARAFLAFAKNHGSGRFAYG